MRMNTSRRPNSQLRYQRQQHCWTQSQVADQLYALLDEAELVAHGVIDKNMVSKWESGLHTPNAFWQGKLCQLFATSPEELGLVKRPEVEQDAVEHLGIIEQEPQLPAASLLPAESDMQMPTHLMVDTSAMHIELLDWPTWCGQQITDFKGLIASWQEQGVACADLQALLHAELERWNTMAQQPDGSVSDVLLARRAVLAALATVPATLLVKVQAGPLTALLLEEFLSQCSASITACWRLLNGDGLATITYALPKYLPLLVALARQPSRYQQTAVYLAAQGYLLMSLVSYHRLRFLDELAYAKQAVELAKICRDRNLYIYALSRLGGAFEINGQPKAMLQARQEAEQYLDEEVAPPLRSHLFSALARAYALNGQVQAAIRYIGAAREPLPDQFGDVPCFIAAHYGLHHLILFEGRTYLALGESDAEHVQQHTQQAMSALAQVGQLSPTITVPERYRVQIINEQAAAAVGVGNMEEFIHYLLAGVEGAKALGSEKRRQEALANYRAARAKWPYEPQVRELAEVFLP